MQTRQSSGCPIELAMDLVGGKWKPLILYRLSEGTLRFNELRRVMPDVTQRMLTLHLRELERDGLVTREVFADVPPRVEYTLTPLATGLLPILSTLGDWAHDYRQNHAGRFAGRRPAVDDEPDASAAQA